MRKIHIQKYNPGTFNKGQIDDYIIKLANIKQDTSLINKYFNNKKYKTKIKDYENEIDLMNKRLEN